MEWKEGIVFMEAVETDENEKESRTLTQHRCWQSSLFMDTRILEAEISTKNKKPRKVRFLTKSDYARLGGR